MDSDNSPQPPMDEDSRSPLQADSGQRIVNERLQQENDIDRQKMYQSQRTPTEAATSLDSTAQTGDSDWQEEVYQKIKEMKDLHFAEVHDIYQELCLKLQEHESSSQQAKSDVVEKFKFFKQTLELMLQYLQVPQSDIRHFHKDRLPTLEKQILGVVRARRARQPGPSLQPGLISQPQLQSLLQNQQSDSQVHQTQSHESGVNSELKSVKVEGSSVPTMQLGEMSDLHGSVSSVSGINSSQPNMMNSLQPGSNLDSGQGNAPISVQQVAMGSIQQNPVSAPQQASVDSLTPQTGVNLFHSTFLDSTAQTGNSDWQEEVYQKIKVMKDLYFTEINDIYEKRCAKLQQLESLPQQAKSEGVGKLKFFKHMLERILQYLQIPRGSIQSYHKERLPTLEKQILSVLSSHGPIKPSPPLQQGQSPQPHLQSLQQNQQSQSHEIGVNSQLQSVNVQSSSVPTLQSDEMSGLHGSVSSLSGINSTQPDMLNSFTEAPSVMERKRETYTAGVVEAAIPKIIGHNHDSLNPAANFDWQEQAYQKIKVMNELYSVEVQAIYQKICAKMQKYEQQQPNSEAIEKLKFFKKMLERILEYLRIPKSNILPYHKARLSALEKQIQSVLSNIPRKPHPP